MSRAKLSLEVLMRSARTVSDFGVAGALVLRVRCFDPRARDTSLSTDRLCLILKREDQTRLDNLLFWIICSFQTSIMSISFVSTFLPFVRGACQLPRTRDAFSSFREISSACLVAPFVGANVRAVRRIVHGAVEQIAMLGVRSTRRTTLPLMWHEEGKGNGRKKIL